MSMRIPNPHRACATFLLLAILAPPVCAKAAGPPSALPSPAGLWEAIDDHTGQAKAIVEIRESNGQIEGRVVQLFHPPAPHPVCLKCMGALKNEPVMGMRILWGMRQSGGEWTGGRILDPENGKIYRCTIAVENGGKALSVRGYIGFSIFGRTEEWVRMEDPPR